MKEYFTQLEPEHIKLLKSMIGKIVKSIVVEKDKLNEKSTKEFRCSQLCYLTISNKEKNQLYEFWNELKPTQFLGDDYTQDDFACYHIEKSFSKSLDESKWKSVPINQIIKDIKIVTDFYHIKNQEGFDSQLSSDVAVIIECADFNILLERNKTWTEITDITFYSGAAELQMKFSKEFCYDEEEDNYEEGTIFDSKRVCWSLSNKNWKQIQCAKNGYKGIIPMTKYEFYQLIFYALDNIYDEQTEKDEKLGELLSDLNPSLWNGIGSADPRYYIEYEKWMEDKSFGSNYGFFLVKPYLQQFDPEYYPGMEKYLEDVTEEEWIDYAKEFLESEHMGE